MRLISQKSYNKGFSLAELLLVISVIAIISAIAVPSFSNVHEQLLESASSELVMALRYARQEAIHSGVPHGVRKLPAQNTIAVFRIDTGQTPPVEVYDVSHPVDKGQLYRLDLENDPRTKATEVLAFFKIYKTAGAQEAITFNAYGEPFDGISGRIMKRRFGGFLLNNGQHGTTVSLSRINGRVTAGSIGAANTDPTSVF